MPVFTTTCEECDQTVIIKTVTLLGGTIEIPVHDDTGEVLCYGPLSVFWMDNPPAATPREPF